MRFCFIVTNLAGGGAEKAILNLAQLLSSRGHLVHLILLQDCIDYPLPEKCTLHILPHSRGFFGKRLTAFRLKRLVRALGPFDQVISTLPYADEIAALARLPSLSHRIANTLSSELAALEKNNAKKGKRRRKRYERLYGKANLIAVSQGVAADLRKLFPQASISYTPNPFDLNGIKAAALQEIKEIPQEPYLLHVGRFAPQKRHDLLFEAFKLTGCREKLVLLTRSSAELLALIDRFGLQERVVIAGFQTNPYPWIARARLLLLCSDWEGLPNVLIEALICKTTVVSTDCPSGPREILKGSLSKFLVPCGSVQLFAEAIRRAREEREEIDEEVVRPFLAEQVALHYEARGL